MINRLMNFFGSIFFNVFKGGRLSAARILGAVDVQLLKIEVPEWQGFVYLGQLTVEGRIQFFEQMQLILQAAKNDQAESNKRYTDLQLRLLVWSLMDEKGQRLFSDSDMAALASKSPIVIGRLFDEIVRFNAFKTESIEEEAKN